MEVTKTKIALVIFLTLIVVGVLSLYFIWDPLERDIFPKCPLYSFTGLYCPGCGSQRALHQMVHGNIIQGIRYNYLLPLLIVVLIYQGFISVMNKVFHKSYYNMFHSSLAVKILLVIILLFWILRNLRFYPFTELAP